ncbi:uncharacterized protein LOC122251652 [Penaeus japonicus]|uniref:uncharacterized protein LOC122251652 n=1 Tax=Penaeus japonicus TaxID=27405 RepID=UPI001C70CC4C|nr:uncharacterized protein LOC122251652 [Penaeus japonicus]
MILVIPVFEALRVGQEGRRKPEDCTCKRMERQTMQLFRVCAWMLLLATPTHSSEGTMSGCRKGTECAQCPSDRYTKDGNGTLLCCHGCQAAELYFGVFPHDWCVCFTKGASDPASRTLVFPDQVGAGSDVRYKDEKYVVNSADRGPSIVSPAVQEALSILADTLEDLNARVTRLEYIFDRSSDSLVSETVNRVGPATPHRPSSSSGSSPSSSSFPSSSCYSEQFSIFQEANTSCEKLGAKLAEPITPKQFTALSQFLSLATETTGFAHWIGGLYLDPSWRWIYKGYEVDLDPLSWISTDERNRRVVPGDISNGRCLSFSFIHRASSYAFGGCECAFEKYYVCEALERTHRML